MHSTPEPQNDLDAVYGEESAQLGIGPELRKDFAPWHHPVKQIVRKYQWAEQIKRLLQERGGAQKLRMFTLPGPDLLDIRFLTESTFLNGIPVEYFGFDSANPAEAGLAQPPEWFNAEASLRQAARITNESLVVSDRLENIAVKKSNAAEALNRQDKFDVINIDACEHLAHAPGEGENTLFGALQQLLFHQMGISKPWLLFVTTRAQPDKLGKAGAEMMEAIHKNLALTGTEFPAALADALECAPANLGATISEVWKAPAGHFLRLYTIALGKYLLQFFHTQVNTGADVELASSCAYRIYETQPDMIALAFRIIPRAKGVVPPGTGGTLQIPNLEPKHATKIAKRAVALRDLDDELVKADGLLAEMVGETRQLLETARYDVNEWANWVRSHPYRPVAI